MQHTKSQVEQQAQLALVSCCSSGHSVGEVLHSDAYSYTNTYSFSKAGVISFVVYVYSFLC